MTLTMKLPINNLRLLYKAYVMYAEENEKVEHKNE